MKLFGVGGANTKTGLVFEGITDLATFLKAQTGYDVLADGTVVYLNEVVGRVLKKYGLYKFLDELKTHLTQSILEIFKILLIIDIKGLLETTYF